MCGDWKDFPYLYTFNGIYKVVLLEICWIICIKWFYEIIFGFIRWDERNCKMTKILFFDVDGTLLNSRKEIPVSAKKALYAARENGYEIAIATGRAPFMIQDILNELEIDSYVSFNGQYVVYKGNPIFTDGVAREQLDAIVHYDSAQNVNFVFLDEREMVANVAGNPMIEGSLATLKYPYPRVEADFYLKEPVYQTLVFIEGEKEVTYKNAFPNVQFVWWHPFSCDILPKDGSKARGIQKFIEAAGVPMSETIAFGDGLNDVEMLSAVGLGVAMGNAHPEALAVADVVAPHVDDDGLYKVMKQLKII